MTDQSVSVLALKSLADSLARAPRLEKLARRTDTDVVDLASEAATSLVHMQGSAEALLTFLPKLNSLTPVSEEFEDCLDEIAEELRHLSYHIANTRLFNYVVAE